MTNISMDTNIVGMAMRDGTIYYCAAEEGLKKLSLSDNSVSGIINRDMTLFAFITWLHLKTNFTTQTMKNIQ